MSGNTPHRAPDVGPELQELLDALPVLVAFVDRDLRYVRVNKTYEEWFQFSRGDAEGKTMAEVLGTAAFEAIRPHVETALSGRRVSFEAKVPYRNGDRWIHAVYLPRDGGFITLVSDISPRKEFEVAQIESLEQFRTLAALAPVGIFRTDAQGDCLYVNERWSQYSGLTAAEALGKGWISALHPDDRQRVFQEWRQAATTGLEFVSEYRFRTPQGKVTWLEGRAGPHRDAQGDIAGYLGTVTDITERRFVQERQRFLSEASSLLASSIDFETTIQNVARMAIPHLADGSAVFMHDSGGRARPMAIFSSDPEKQRIVEDLIARYPPRPDSAQGMALVMKTGVSAFYPEISEAFLKAAAVDEEHLRLIRTLGLRSTIAVPILVRGETRGVISFASSSRAFGPDDLTLAEELARRAAMAIDNAQHYREAKDAVRAREEFLSIASHELKTPLTTLLLQLQGLRRSLRPESNVPLDREALSKPVDAAMIKGQELADMINELLEISSLVAGNLHLDVIDGVDLAASARYVAGQFREELWKTGGVVHINAPSPVIGTWDPMRMEQALTNLISNAVKYGGGKDVFVDVHGAGPAAVISVRDQGIGVAAEDLQRIFMPFERSPRTNRYTGWGLGLHIVKQIVEAHGGTIEIESTPGQGATFTMRAPRSPKNR